MTEKYSLLLARRNFSISVEWWMSKLGGKRTRISCEELAMRGSRWVGWDTMVKESLGFLQFIGILSGFIRRDPGKEQREVEDERAQGKKEEIEVKT